MSGYSLETSVKLFNFYGIDIKNLIEKIYSDYLFLEDNLMNNLYDFQDYVKYVSFLENLIIIWILVILIKNYQTVKHSKIH